MAERSCAGTTVASPSRIVLHPIGYVKRAEKRSAPPDELRRTPAQIILKPELTPGLEGIKRFRKLVVIFYCHQVKGFPLQVRPRRDASQQRRGVFASRSPARPNPLGLTVVTLQRVEGNVLHVHGLDALDGTPVLDIKPFDPTFDRGEEAE